MVCTVCLEPIQSNGILTACGHSFHKDCCIQVILNNTDCPNCRTPFPDGWLYNNDILPILSTKQYLTTLSERLDYWEQVEEALEKPPAVGPMLPSHQRWYDMDILEIEDSRPAPWTHKWIMDRICEMRIRFNISMDITLDERDVLNCETNGINGIFPEWSLTSKGFRLITYWK